jgi:hypothetical protein
MQSGYLSDRSASRSQSRLLTGINKPPISRLNAQLEVMHEYWRCLSSPRHPWACSFESARTSMLPCHPEKLDSGRKGDV